MSHPEKPTDGKPPARKNIVSLQDEREKRWKNLLHKTNGKVGKPRKVLANALIALRESPDWKDALRFDENSLLVQLERQPPPPWPKQKVWIARPWKDQDDGLFSEWLSKHDIDLSLGTVSEAAHIVARERAFHPVREYLNSLTWDGKPRIENWLSTYVGAKFTKYHCAIGPRFLISAVARIMQPGCQADCMPIFEGLYTGEGKSSLLRELSSPWFSDQAKDLGSKDTAMSIAGVWIVEIAELEGFKGASAEQLKAFISRRVDRFRPPYGRHVIDNPRQCVFVGTTNKDQYLMDETGNRRYWPVRCGQKLDVAGIVRDRDQLWAEAKAQYENKMPWWLDKQELTQLAAAQQDSRFEPEPMEPEIAKYVEDKTVVTIEEILIEVMELDRKSITQTDQKKVGKILRHLDWVRTQDEDADRKQRRVFKKLDRIPPSSPSGGNSPIPDGTTEEEG